MGSIVPQISEGNPIERAFGTTLIVLGLIVLTNRHKVRRNLHYCWPILLFLIYCLISLTWSEFPDVAFKRLIRESGNLVMILVVWTERSPVTALKRLLARTAYTLIPLSILFCRYYPFGKAYGYWTGELTYTGVSEDKNGLAQLCLICGLASIWRMLNLAWHNDDNSHRLRQLMASLVIIVMVIYLFMLADSVTSRVCMALSTALLFAVRARIVIHKRFMIHVLLLLMVAVPTSIALLGVSPAALQAMGRDATLTDRTLLWTWVLRLVPNQVIGVGYASFWVGPRLDVLVKNVTHTWVPYQAHNGYLEIFLNLGWIGIVLLGVVIWYGYLRTIRLWRSRHPAADLMLAYFLMGVVSNITEASFFRNLFPIWLCFMLAITMPPVRRKNVSSESTTTGSSFLPALQQAVIKSDGAGQASSLRLFCGEAPKQWNPEQPQRVGSN